MSRPSISRTAAPPSAARSLRGARIRSPLHCACECEEHHGDTHHSPRLPHLLGADLPLAGRHDRLRRALARHRPGARRSRRHQRRRQVHPAATARRSTAPVPGVGDRRRQPRPPSAEHHPRHNTAGGPGPGYRRSARRAARHRGRGRRREALRDDRRRLGRRGTGPGDTGLARPRWHRTGPHRGAVVRRGDRPAQAGRAAVGAPRRPSPGRAHQQPRCVRAPQALRGRRLLALGRTGSGQPRPGTAGARGPDRRTAHRLGELVRRWLVGLRGGRGRRTGGRRADVACGRGRCAPPEARTGGNPCEAGPAPEERPEGGGRGRSAEDPGRPPEAVGAGDPRAGFAASTRSASTRLANAGRRPPTRSATTPRSG